MPDQDAATRHTVPAPRGHRLVRWRIERHIDTLRCLEALHAALLLRDGHCGAAERDGLLRAHRLALSEVIDSAASALSAHDLHGLHAALDRVGVGGEVSRSWGLPLPPDPAAGVPREFKRLSCLLADHLAAGCLRGHGQVAAGSRITPESPHVVARRPRSQ